MHFGHQDYFTDSEETETMKLKALEQPFKTTLHAGFANTGR